jgi:hypothetical protein
MGRRILQVISSDRLTREAHVAVVYDDVDQLITDIEVVNNLTIPVTVQARDRRDGDLIPNQPITVNPGQSRSLSAPQRSQLHGKGIRRRAHNAQEAMSWTPDELAAQIELIFLPVEG